MNLRSIFIICCSLALGACTMAPPHSIVYLPTTAKPHPPTLPRGDGDSAQQSKISEAQNGTIFASSSLSGRLGSRGFLDLYSDSASMAHKVGDILTVLIQERASASSADNSQGSYAGSSGMSITGDLHLPFIPDSFEQHFRNSTSASGKANASHKGNGSVSSSNAFSGSISVTVLEVLDNGNLLVSGEKQLRINNETDVIRLSGVVNPQDILYGNTVVSTRLADARVERINDGYKRLYSEPGWLTRFFLSIKPF